MRGMWSAWGGVLLALLVALPAVAQVRGSAYGCAFVDDNFNGTRDAGEAALPGLIVSDGNHLVVTDAQGRYALTGIDCESQHFVFIESPSGYRCRNGFYRRLSVTEVSITADFAFVPAPETAQADFTFAQITDLHVTNEWQTLLDDLNEVARLKPAFIIATGDLVERGSERTWFENYRKAIDQCPVPVISVIGNHDETGNGTANYEDLLGPTYYAFDYGNRHFVIFNCLTKNLDAHYDWLQRELALQPKNKEIYVFQHYPPDARLMALLSRFNTIAVYSGHWHSAKILTTGPRAIKCINTPSLRFGGIDVSPRGFRITTFAKGKMAVESRVGGVKAQCQIVSPAVGQTVPRGPLSIEAVVYDSGARVHNVRFQIDGGRLQPLQPAGAFTWTGTTAVTPGEHTMRILAESDDWTGDQQVRFTVGTQRAPVPRMGQDWPMFQHDAARSGIAADVVSPPLTPAWRTHLGGVTNLSSPVVAGGRLYIGVADEEDRGRAGVYALDARTGKVRWHFRTATSIKHTVAVADGLVFAASVDGLVYAIDAANGKERWRYSLGDALDRWVFSAPVVLDSTVYVGVGPSFVALEARTGKERWHSKDLGNDWISGRCSPAVDAGHLYVPVNWSKGLSALDRHTGKILWQKRPGLDTGHATPTLSGGMLYYPANKALHALDPATGDERWKFPLPGSWSISSPVVIGGTVLIGGGDGCLYALDAVTGAERWRVQLGAPRLAFSPYERNANPLIGSPAVSGSTVYLGGTDGQLYAIDVATGKVQWAYPLGLPITASPAISGNTVYISTYDGTVYAMTQ